MQAIKDRIGRLKGQREVLKMYLESKFIDEDWHAVQDAGSDLRDIDSEIKGLEIAFTSVVEETMTVLSESVKHIVSRILAFTSSQCDNNGAMKNCQCWGCSIHDGIQRIVSNE